jgi:imidazolonepropionase-like amidohydrolase
VPGGALVLLDGGRIVGVEPGAPPAPDGCEVLEAPGGTVLPGLVDAHVHLCADGTDASLDRIEEPGGDAMAAVIGQSLRRHLAAGVTTVRDLGDRRFAVLGWRSSAHGRGVYPAVVAAGPPITSVGGHCASMGGAAAGEDQLRAAVLERAERGVDVVKVMVSGGFATAGTQVMLCQFTLGEIRAVVGQAHAAGLPVTAHAHGLPAVHMAMAAGADGIEQVIEMNKRRVGQMHAAGVRIVSGSDGGVAAAKPHGQLPVSAAFLAEGGVSTAAALASATSLAAAACGLGDRKGRLRAGYDAGLLVVDGDPVADIAALARPAAVFADGRRPAAAA